MRSNHKNNHVRRFRNEQQIARKRSHQHRYFHGDLFYRHFRGSIHRFYPDFHSAYQRDRAACGRYSDDVVLLQNQKIRYAYHLRGAARYHYVADRHGLVVHPYRADFRADFRFYDESL